MQKKSSLFRHNNFIIRLAVTLDSIGENRTTFGRKMQNTNTLSSSGSVKEFAIESNINPFSRRERESIRVRWPRGWTVRGSLVKFATVQQFKWGEALERSKVRSLCVHPAWHLRGSTMMTTMVFLSPGNAWFGRGGKRGHGRIYPPSFSLLSRESLFSLNPLRVLSFLRMALFPRATRLIAKWWAPP